ncbi:MAG: FG-GAP-like repeat-containing protein [Ghiorsea sp.]|nr:FG-GAP-like repeat-containing protein [Ghiorsea sp.]
MRIFMVFLALFVASCSDTASLDSSATDVTVSIGSQPAAGAIGAVGDIPLRVQSIKVTAINASGQVIAGPVIANRPSLTATLRIPNGNNIRIRVVAFDALNAQGTKIYETLSAPINLTGAPVTVPVKMSLSVDILTNTTQTFRGGTVNLAGTVSGTPPVPSSPLVWATTGGSFVTPLDAYGAVRTWVAPNTLGAQTIATRIDPAINPDQDPNVKASIQISVINRDPYVANFNATPIDIYAGSSAQLPLIVVGDLDGDTLSALTQGAPTWVSLVSTGTNPLSIDLSLTPPLGTNGQFSFQVGITDGFGGNISKSITLSVNATLPAPVVGVFGASTFTSVDIYGYALVGSTVDLYANGNTFIAQVLPGTFSEFTFIPNMGDFFYNALNVPNGTHTITAYARLGNNVSTVSNTVSVTVNKLLGTAFTSTPLPAQAGAPASIATTDLNQDFIKDIILADANGAVYIYAGTGTIGTIQGATPVVGFPIFTGAAGMNQFAIGDVNGDTYTDVVLPSSTNNTVTILPGTAAGSFAQPLPPLNIDAYAAPKAVAIADINTDGYADIITANSGSILGPNTGNTVSALNGSAQGAFTLGTPLTITGQTGGLSSIATSDFNVDGYADVAIAGSSIAVVTNNPITPIITNYPTSAAPVHITIGILGGNDSLDDIVTCNSNGTITILLSGTGGFPTSITSTLPFGSIPTSAAIGDINGDFIDDIVVAVSGTNTIAILINDGLGNFSPPILYPITGIDPVSIALADIDGDSKLDVIVANKTSKDMNLLLNTSIPLGLF